MSLDTAKTIGLVVAVGLFIVALGSAWAAKKVATKFLSVIIFGGLALGVWTQRSNLSDCATKAQERVKVGDTRSISCTFFSTEVDIGI